MLVGVGEVVRDFSSCPGADGLLQRRARHEGVDEFAVQRLPEQARRGSVAAARGSARRTIDGILLIGIRGSDAGLMGH